MKHEPFDAKINAPSILLPRIRIVIYLQIFVDLKLICLTENFGLTIIVDEQYKCGEGSTNSNKLINSVLVSFL